MPADLELLLAEGRWLRRLARSLLADDPDDAVQEVYLAAVAARPSTSRPVRPWLAQVLRNLARMRRRRGGRTRRLLDRVIVEPANPLPTPEELLQHHETQRLVAAAVSALEEPYRTTVLLRYSEGLTPSEMATRLGIPAATVRSRLKRGLDEIRRTLDGGPRAKTWRALLAPLAQPPGRRARGRTTFALTFAAAVVITVAGGLAITGDRRSAPGAPAGRESAAEPPPPAPSPPSSGRPAAIVAPERRRMAAALATLVSAARAPEVDDPRLAAAVDECVQIRQKLLPCREEYAARAVEEFLSNRGRTVSAPERERLEGLVLDQTTKDGEGPLGERQASCRRMIALLVKRGASPTAMRSAEVHACFEHADCPAQVRCYLALAASLLGTPLNR
jgi:RNA polymerase sigma-70 factor (ECF subfamily)